MCKSMYPTLVSPSRPRFARGMGPGSIGEHGYLATLSNPNHPLIINGQTLDGVRVGARGRSFFSFLSIAPVSCTTLD